MFLLQACTPQGVQAPTVDLHEVHSNGVHRIAFDADGGRLASGGLHGGLSLWSTADGKRLGSFAGHAAPITGLAWLGNDRLLSADRSGLVLLHRVETGDVIARKRLDGVNRLAVTADKARAVLIDRSGVTSLSLPQLHQLQHYKPASAPIALAIDPVSLRVVVSTRNGQVLLLDRELVLLDELEKPSRDVHALAFSPDGRTLLGGAWFRLLVWDLDSGELRELPTEHRGKINSVAISPDGRTWLSLGRETDSNFQLIDAQTHSVLRRFTPHNLCGQQARFSPDGRYAASSADDGSIHIYDLQQPYKTYVPYLESE